MISVTNIFRYTIEDCNRIMFILKEYVDKQLQQLGYSEDRKYLNCYLFLEIFENRTEETLQELLKILKEYNVRTSEKATKLTCFYYTYLDRNIKEKGFSKKVEDASKIKLYCTDILEYLLKYKQLFRLMYRENYKISLENRLKRIKDCLFETTLVGFDELNLTNLDILKLNERGMYDLSIFMINFYNSIYNDNEDIFYKTIFSKICCFNLLHPIFDKNKSIIGKIKLSYPYNLYMEFYDCGIKDILSIFKIVKENSYEGIFESYVDSVLKYVLPNRKYEIVIDKLKNDMTFKDIGLKNSLCQSRIQQIYREVIIRFRKFTRIPGGMLSKNNLVEYMEKYMRGGFI